MSDCGVVIWFTGLPASGKSTIARGVATRLREAGRAVIVLDSDELRAALRPAPGYDDAGRDAFYETLARIAALAAAQGLSVLVPATAHRREYRARARALAPSFVEVFVDTPLELCERRDPKGLYARARELGGGTMPGLGVPFEAPESPALVIRPGERDAAERVIALIERLRAPL